MDIIIRGQRYREPLDTSDWREAKRIERASTTHVVGADFWRVSHFPATCALSR
jgi:hypothetical protein